MRTMRKINKPIKFFGLSSGQFAIFMLLTAIIIIVSIFKQLHPILIIGIISAILFLSRQITDKRQIFKFILKQQP